MAGAGVRWRAVPLGGVQRRSVLPGGVKRRAVACGGGRRRVAACSEVRWCVEMCRCIQRHAAVLARCVSASCGVGGDCGCVQGVLHWGEWGVPGCGRA